MFLAVYFISADAYNRRTDTENCYGYPLIGGYYDCIRSIISDDCFYDPCSTHHII